MRYVVGIVLLFMMVVGVNFTMAWLAIQGRDPVVPSYAAKGH